MINGVSPPPPFPYPKSCHYSVFSICCQVHLTLEDFLMRPLCMRSQSVASATLTQQNATTARRNWAKLSKTAASHEGICGSPINCGLGTTDSKTQKEPAWSPAQWWGLTTLVWNMIDKIKGNTNPANHFFFLSDLYLMHWPEAESLTPGHSNREMRAETWRALEELYEEGNFIKSLRTDENASIFLASDFLS